MGRTSLEPLEDIEKQHHNQICILPIFRNFLAGFLNSFLGHFCFWNLNVAKCSNFFRTGPNSFIFGTWVAQWVYWLPMGTKMWVGKVFPKIYGSSIPPYMAHMWYTGFWPSGYMFLNTGPNLTYNTWNRLRIFRWFEWDRSRVAAMPRTKVITDSACPKIGKIATLIPRTTGCATGHDFAKTWQNSECDTWNRPRIFRWIRIWPPFCFVTPNKKITKSFRLCVLTLQRGDFWGVFCFRKTDSGRGNYIFSKRGHCQGPVVKKSGRYGLFSKKYKAYKVNFSSIFGIK